MLSELSNTREIDVSKTLERKVVVRFRYDGFGFPITVDNAPMVRVRGEWTLDVNYNTLEQRVLKLLAEKPVRLTGNEIRFIRLWLGMTLERFAERFNVSHQAVMKWEQAGDEPPGMKWAHEKDIRLEVLRSLETSPSSFIRVYKALAEEPARKIQRLRVALKGARRAA